MWRVSMYGSQGVVDEAVDTLVSVRCIDGHNMAANRNGLRHCLVVVQQSKVGLLVVNILLEMAII